MCVYFSYKQMQINVKNATWDLMYYTSPYDTNTTDQSAWSAGIQKNVFADGTINTPGDIGNFSLPSRHKEQILSFKSRPYF